MSGHYLKHHPDKNGWFGEYGGAFLPPELEKPFAEIADAYARISVSADFQNELQYIRKHFQGRPTPIHYARNLSDAMGGACIYLKREDLNHTGAHKLNHCMADCSPTITYGADGEIHGFRTLVLTDNAGQPAPVHSIASGLDYPGVGPEHAYLHKIGRVHYATVNDDQTLDAFYQLSKLEGIIPALESAHAVAHAMRLAPDHPGETILVNLSGRGDKDIDYVVENFGYNN